MGDQNYLHSESSRGSNVDSSASSLVNCANSQENSSSNIEANSDINTSRCEPSEQSVVVNTSLSPGFRENTENGELNNSEENTRTSPEQIGIGDGSIELNSTVSVEESVENE